MWILAAALLLPARGTSAAEEGQTGVTTDSLLAAITSYDSQGDPDYDVYYAYNSYGELMFSVKEPFSKPYFVSDLIFYSADGESKIHNELLDESIQLTYLWQLDSEGKLTEESTCLTLADGREMDVLSRTDAQFSYGEDGLSGTYQVSDGSTGEIAYDENLNQILRITRDSEGKILYSYEVTYDEYGNYLTESTYYDGNDAPIERAYEYELNEYGQPQRTTAYTGGEAYLTLSDYSSLASVPEEIRNDPLVGYWSAEQDGTERFLCIAMNGMLCYGYMDERIDMPVVSEYAYWSSIEDGVLYCEIYQNCSYESRSEEIQYALDGDQLMFDGITYARAD